MKVQKGENVINIKRSKKTLVTFAASTAILLFLIGILVGVGIQKWRENSKEMILKYVSSTPMLLTITEKEMKQKDELLDLFKKYGQDDPDSDIAGVHVIPKEQKELLMLLPEGSNILFCMEADGEPEICYDLNGINYHVCYGDGYVTKAVEFKYNNKPYYIYNLDNKEFECHRMK
ncbi:MAG: hypothetical protein Q4F05_17070 [bacterium]|nr:hypothetical protein [bacterium]